MVLADVSTLGRDSGSGRPYRNGNVMYEVGIALACRQPQEVLLVRDDQHPFLFDVSTIPHMTLDLTDIPAARTQLTQELVLRLNERRFVEDARVRMAVSRLTGDEMAAIRVAAKWVPGGVWRWTDQGGLVYTLHAAAVSRLVDKQVIRVAGQFDDGATAYEFTELGRAVAGLVAGGLRRFAADEPLETPDAGRQGEPNSENA
jgi:hypothetical protein